MSSEDKNPSFISGSYIYGTPTDESDIDLVIYIEEPLAMWLHAMLNQGEDHSHTPAFGSVSIKHGRLNLICCWHQWVYDLWLKGTNQLVPRRPVTRDQAIALFDTLRFGTPQQRLRSQPDYGGPPPEVRWGLSGDDIPF